MTQLKVLPKSNTRPFKRGDVVITQEGYYSIFHSYVPRAHGKCNIYGVGLSENRDRLITIHRTVPVSSLVLGNDAKIQETSDLALIKEYIDADENLVDVEEFIADPVR